MTLSDALAWGLPLIGVAVLIDLTALVVAVLFLRRRRGVR